MKTIKALGLAALTVLALTAFSGLASAAGPSFFVAGGYPASLEGKGSEQGSLSTVVGTSKCESPLLTGTLSKPSGALTPIAEYKYSCGAVLSMNGCQLTFNPPSEGINGTVSIGGAGCSGITGQQGGVNILILPQSGLAATFENKGSGSSATVKINLQATGLQYKVTSKGALEGSYSNGTYTTAWTLSGKYSGSSTGISIAPYPGFSVIGEGEGRLFHSDLYPATIGGEQVEGKIEGKTYSKNELSTVVGALKCNTATFTTPSFLFPEGLEEDVQDLMLAPTHKGCTLVGLNATVTPVSGCFYDFNVAGPQAGNMGLCSIQVKVLGSACAINIEPQTRSGLEFVNVGSGSSAQVEAKANVAGIAYQVVEGAKCPNHPPSGAYSDGKYRGVIALKVAKVG